MKEILNISLLQAIENSDKIIIIDPVGFLDIISLEKNAKLIITDSGGLQKEAYFFRKPCVILRSETEWVEIVGNGNALLADADFSKIVQAVHTLIHKNEFTYPIFFGDGKAAEYICERIIHDLL